MKERKNIGIHNWNIVPSETFNNGMFIITLQKESSLDLSSLEGSL